MSAEPLPHTAEGVSEKACARAILSEGATAVCRCLGSGLRRLALGLRGLTCGHLSSCSDLRDRH